MSHFKKLQGECQQCGGLIEFSAEATGTTTDCPLCGQATELVLRVPEVSAGGRQTRGIVYAIIAIFILAAGLVATLVVLKRAQRIATQPHLSSATANSVAAPSPFVETGFGVSPVSLETNNGSSLVYAVGTISNQTNRQRFGVRVEIDLFDATSSKIGSARDYRSILEPRAEWRFRALVVEKYATSARIVAIKEDR